MIQILFITFITAELFWFIALEKCALLLKLLS